jgi:hypothetical protein
MRQLVNPVTVAVLRTALNETPYIESGDKRKTLYIITLRATTVFD